MSVAARAADIHGGPKIFKDVCRSYQSDMWPQHTWRKQRSSVELVEGTPLQRATDLQRTLICATLVQFQSCTNASCCWPNHTTSIWGLLASHTAFRLATITHLTINVPALICGSPRPCDMLPFGDANINAQGPQHQVCLWLPR